jgi:hypothetical protein
VRIASCGARVDGVAGISLTVLLPR